MTSWTITEPRRLDIDGDVVRLDVTLVAGRLNVVGTDGPPRLEVSKVGTNIDVSVEGGVLSVRHPFPKTWPSLLQPLWWWINGQKQVKSDVSIAVPYGTPTVLRMTAGEVVASSLHADLTVDVVSGRITLLGNDGRLRAKVISGPIEALGCAGDLTAETVSGEITIADSATSKVFAKTVSGTLTADLDNPPENSDIYLETISGQITIRIREDSDLTVRLSAAGGQVNSAFPGLPAEGKGATRGWANRLNGVLGKGTGTLAASAIGGGITLLPRPVDGDFGLGESQ